MTIKFVRSQEFYSDWWQVAGPGDEVVLVFAEEGSDEGYALAEKIDKLMNGIR